MENFKWSIISLIYFKILRSDYGFMAAKIMLKKFYLFLKITPIIETNSVNCMIYTTIYCIPILFHFIILFFLKYAYMCIPDICFYLFFDVTIINCYQGLHTPY